MKFGNLWSVLGQLIGFFLTAGAPIQYLDPDFLAILKKTMRNLGLKQSFFKHFKNIYLCKFKSYVVHGSILFIS